MRIPPTTTAFEPAADYTPQRAAETDAGQPGSQHTRPVAAQVSEATAGKAPMQPPQEIEARLADLPKEVGVLLVTIGTMGVVLPGIVGTPALLAGGLMLWPRGFRVVNGWLERKCPKLHGHGAAQLIRYLDDLERRYPNATRRG